MEVDEPQAEKEKEKFTRTLDLSPHKVQTSKTSALLYNPILSAKQTQHSPVHVRNLSAAETRSYVTRNSTSKLS